MQNTAKQNYPGSVTSYDTWPGNKVGLFYNAPESTWGLSTCNSAAYMSRLMNNRQQRFTMLEVAAEDVNLRQALSPQSNSLGRKWYVTEKSQHTFWRWHQSTSKHQNYNLKVKHVVKQLQIITVSDMNNKSMKSVFTQISHSWYHTWDVQPQIDYLQN